MLGKKGINYIGIVCILLFVLYLIYLSIHVKHELSRVVNTNTSEVKALFLKEKIACKSILECNLKPGDILIRRYVTERTYMYDKLLHPFFTHSAFYIGDGKIIEASGTEDNTEDDISIKNLADTDWMNQGIESLVIVRPNTYTTLKDDIERLIHIAEDKNYIFGFEEGNTSCSELIYRNTSDAYKTKVPSDLIITPDYLFQLSIKEGFKIIKINK
jgi:hypothetical protein